MLEMLQLGGDQLVFVESSYEIPIGALVLPKLGVPTLELRHLMGTAGVGSLPNLEQELGIGLRLSVLRFEATFDAAGELDSRAAVTVVLGR